MHSYVNCCCLGLQVNGVTQEIDVYGFFAEKRIMVIISAGTIILYAQEVWIIVQQNKEIIILVKEHTKQPSGLCGSYDDNVSNDYNMRSGSRANSAEDFVESWEFGECKW